MKVNFTILNDIKLPVLHLRGSHFPCSHMECSLKLSLITLLVHMLNSNIGSHKFSPWRMMSQSSSINIWKLLLTPNLNNQNRFVLFAKLIVPFFFFSYIPHPLLELCLVSPFAIVCPIAPGISSHKSLPSSLTFYNLDILTFAHSHPRASFLHTYQLVCNPIIPVYNLSYSHTYACVLPSF